MAPSPNNHPSLCFAVMAIFFVSLTLLPPKSAGMDNEITSSNYIDDQMKKMILGSTPPSCRAEKCMNCRPCEATLVIPPHRSNVANDNDQSKFFYEKSYRRDEDDSYYLLSWKCRCGDKFFQP